MPPVIRAFQMGDRNALVNLWNVCGLTRPANDPRRDIERKLVNDPENLFVLEADGAIAGSVILGYSSYSRFLRSSGTTAPIRREMTLKLLGAWATVTKQSAGCLNNAADGASILPSDAIERLKGIV